MRWLVVLVLLSSLLPLYIIFGKIYNPPPKPDGKSRFATQNLSGRGMNMAPPTNTKTGAVHFKRMLAIKEAKRKGLGTYTFEVKYPPPPIISQ